VPEAVDQAIQRALAQVPGDRFPTAAAFAEALETVTTPTATPTAVGLPQSRPPAPDLVTTAPSPARPQSPAARRARRLPLAAITLALGFVIGLGVLFAWRRTRAGAEADTGAAGAGGTKRVAVLPFENLGDSSTAYFADGMTDEVRGKLSQLPGLAVTARASSNEYRHTTKPPQVIARELGADYLLTATVRWEKRPDGTSRVRVSPELVRVAPGAAPTTTWQQAFDASLTDVFQVQADIASKVALSLDLALGSTERQALTEKPTANLAAYDAFLKGEAASQGIAVTDPASLRRAISSYQQAVVLDSTFLQAWAQLARAQAYYYYVGTPTPAAAELARTAAERAGALAAGRPEGQLALGDYHAEVLNEPGQALAAYEAGLKIAPSNAELLTASALAEQSLGRWEAALAHLQRAQTLDPRAVLTSRRLSLTLIRLRRYPEALVSAEHGVALSPTNLQLIELLAMVHLAQGDLPGARAVIKAVPSEVSPTALVAFMANYWDLYWVLDDGQQRLLLRLPPSAFDDDRSTWGIALAQTYWLRGEKALARAYADSSRMAEDKVLRDTPDNAQQLIFRGLALAYMGKKAEAIQDGERSVAIMPIAKDGYTGPYLQHILARIYLLSGEPDKALDHLEPLLKIPYHLSPGWLRIDPTFASLKGNPRFERLLAGG
jgi:serine/threonine-protein kinase